MATVPYTFANQSGDVPASELDANFAACAPGTATGPVLLGVSGDGPGDVEALDFEAAYLVVKPAIPVEITAFMGGSQGGASWQVLRYQPAFAVLFFRNDCVSSSGVAATASTTFIIADNGVQIGTVVFSASGSVGVVSLNASPYTLAIGHVLTVTGPASADATLANVNFTLGGTRA